MRKLKKNPFVTWVRHLGAALLVRGFYRGSSLLPWRLLVCLGRGAGSALFTLSRPFHPRALRNLETIWPGRVSAREAAAIARDSYRNLAVTMLEQGKMRRMGKDSFLSLVEYETEQVELLRGLVGRGRGVVYASAHFGNWEMLAEFGARLGFTMSVLYKPPTNPHLDRFLHRIRGSNRLIDINSDLSAVVRRLRLGEGISLLFDENARRRGIRIPFFGYEASTYRGPAYFALRAGAPIVCLYFLRLPDGRHRFLIERVIEPVRRGRLEEDIVRVMVEMNQSLEKVILAYPGQWNWPYRRWGRKPVPVERAETS